MEKRIWKPLILVSLVLVVLVTSCENPAGAEDDVIDIDGDTAGDTGSETGGDTVGETDGDTGDDTSTGTTDTFSEYVYIPPGSFQRDGTETNITEITQGLKMSRYPVTQAQFEAVMGTNPSSFSGGEDAPNRPVEQVSWYHAIAYANKLSISEGLTPVYSVSGVDFSNLTFDDVPTTSSNSWNAPTANWDADGYRLPTEMERLWAAMGATSGHDYPGTGVYTTGYSKPFAGSTDENSAADYAWFFDNSVSSTQPVGTRLPNELGIYDMSGNVLEWVWDRNRTSANYPFGTLTDYRGNDDTSVVRRVTRGGGWGSDVLDLAIAGRNGLGFGARDPWVPGNSFGFRLVRLYDPDPEE